MAFVNKLVTAGSCGTGSGSRIELVNTDTHQRYKVTVRITVHGSGGPVSNDRIYSQNAGQRQFMGCTFGGVPSSSIARRVVGESPF